MKKQTLFDQNVEESLRVKRTHLYVFIPKDFFLQTMFSRYTISNRRQYCWKVGKFQDEWIFRIENVELMIIRVIVSLEKTFGSIVPWNIVLFPHKNISTWTDKLKENGKKEWFGFICRFKRFRMFLFSCFREMTTHFQILRQQFSFRLNMKVWIRISSWMPFTLKVIDAFARVLLLFSNFNVNRERTVSIIFWWK